LHLSDSHCRRGFSIWKIWISSGNSRFPIAGRHFPQEISDWQLPDAVFLRKFPSANCRLTFSSGNFRIAIAGRRFPEEIAGFLRKIWISNCRTVFSSGNSRFAIAGRDFPQEIAGFLRKIWISNCRTVFSSGKSRLPGSAERGVRSAECKETRAERRVPPAPMRLSF
jgi:hypothetical protein